MNENKTSFDYCSPIIFCVKGEQGEDGEVGLPGKPGNLGKTGVRGLPGIQGSFGPKVSMMNGTVCTFCCHFRVNLAKS